MVVVVVEVSTDPSFSKKGKDASDKDPCHLQEVIVAVPEGAMPGEELEIPLPPQVMV